MAAVRFDSLLDDSESVRAGFDPVVRAVEACWSASAVVVRLLRRWDGFASSTDLYAAYCEMVAIPASARAFMRTLARLAERGEIARKPVPSSAPGMHLFSHGQRFEYSAIGGRS